jgi:hypothetical protein
MDASLPNTHDDLTLYEAGVAVVAALLGRVDAVVLYRPTIITVDGETQLEARTFWHAKARPDECSFSLIHAAVAVAGFVALEVLSGEDQEAFITNDAWPAELKQFNQIVERAAAAEGIPPLALSVQIIQATAALLRQHADAVWRVEEELSYHGILMRDELRDLIIGACA